ncbi:hypothetical protein QJS04_geneDACA013752 [Acorus gramineus]|uniref:Uncharacterized protein n=1 Tax=Acorus gramineus TaxID=55184 RepID=A0AAV9B014_ACOGR|nr:hypothetical protein QJS04_geneDACA013752 [Acorus gramineus]
MYNLLKEGMAKWRTVPRPVMETALNTHALRRHRVRHPLFLHGPRGSGKTSLILHRLLDSWNVGPHITGYVNFAADRSPKPWASWSASPAPPADLADLRSRLESCLESMVDRGVRLGRIRSRDVFLALRKHHGIDSALRRIVGGDVKASSLSTLWSRAVLARGCGGGGGDDDASMTMEEMANVREAGVSLRLAKEIIDMHLSWRAGAVAHLNRTGGVSMPLAHSSTDWPCLLLELLSSAAGMGIFQPKLVIDNIEVLRKATSMDESMVPAGMYHDSLLWRLVNLGMNETCLPVIFITSDSYYSYQAFVDFGNHQDVFISRENFGWTPKEAKMHLVPKFFSESEWPVIAEVLGPNPRHLSELYELIKSTYFGVVMEDSRGNIQDTVDAYLAYLQVNVVNPAMESALVILQKFASDARNGKIPVDRLLFGVSWRNLPRTEDPLVSLQWAKLQLMDYVQSLIKTGFGVNYLSDFSFEILDDPATVAMLEVGLLYAQRDRPYIRPVSRAIQRCLVRWLVQEQIQMSFKDSVRYRWHRIIRGRSYRHLMNE